MAASSERTTKLQEVTPYLPHSFFLQKEQKGTSARASQELIDAFDLQRKINSNFTPTGCVAQLCQNIGIIRDEDDVA